MSSDEQLVQHDFPNLFKISKWMWIFIVVDFIVFAGLLAYHFTGSSEFHNDYLFAKSQLLFSFAFFNTIVILTSGLTMGLAKVAAFNKNAFLSIVFVFVTFVLAMIFVANRLIDCTYLVGNGYQFGTEAFGELNAGVASFFTSYFIIYFLFMAHLLVGIVFLILSLLKLIKDAPIEEKHSKLNFTVVYWSYLTIVWSVVFPVLFLI